MAALQDSQDSLYSRAAKHVLIDDIWIDVSIDETHTASAEVTEHPVERGANIADHVRQQPKTLVLEGLVTNHPIEYPRSHMSGARQIFSSEPITAAKPYLPRIAPTTAQIEGEPKSAGGFELVPFVGQGLALAGALKIERARVQLAATQYNVDKNAVTNWSATVLHFEPFNRVEAVHAALMNIVDTSKLVTVVTGLTTYENVAITDLTIKRGGDVGPNSLRFTATCRVLTIVNSKTLPLPEPSDTRAKSTKSRGKQATTTPPAGLIPLPYDPTQNSSGLEKAFSGDF